MIPYVIPLALGAAMTALGFLSFAVQGCRFVCIGPAPSSMRGSGLLVAIGSLFVYGGTFALLLVPA